MQWVVKDPGTHGTPVRVWYGGQTPPAPTRPATRVLAIRLVLLAVLGVLVQLARPDLLAPFVSAVLTVALIVWIARSV
jgi:hypothetical protein